MKENLKATFKWLFSTHSVTLCKFNGAIFMKKLFLLTFVCLVLVGCGKATQTMSGEFSSMDSCLLSIEKKSGYSLEIITDKLGNVSGFLKGTKLGFGCQAESTGTKGLIVRGWYQVEE